MLLERNMFMGSLVIRRFRIISQEEQIASMPEIQKGAPLLARLSLFLAPNFPEKRLGNKRKKKYAQDQILF